MRNKRREPQCRWLGEIYKPVWWSLPSTAGQFSLRSFNCKPIQLKLLRLEWYLIWKTKIFDVFGTLSATEHSVLNMLEKSLKDAYSGDDMMRKKSKPNDFHKNSSTEFKPTTTTIARSMPSEVSDNCMSVVDSFCRETPTIMDLRFAIQKLSDISRDKEECHLPCMKVVGVNHETDEDHDFEVSRSHARIMKCETTKYFRAGTNYDVEIILNYLSAVTPFLSEEMIPTFLNLPESVLLPLIPHLQVNLLANVVPLLPINRIDGVFRSLPSPIILFLVPRFSTQFIEAITPSLSTDEITKFVSVLPVQYLRIVVPLISQENISIMMGTLPLKTLPSILPLLSTDILVHVIPNLPEYITLTVFKTLPRSAFTRLAPLLSLHLLRSIVPQLPHDLVALIITSLKPETIRALLPSLSVATTQTLFANLSPDAAMAVAELMPNYGTLTIVPSTLK